MEKCAQRLLCTSMILIWSGLAVNFPTSWSAVASARMHSGKAVSILLGHGRWLLPMTMNANTAQNKARKAVALNLAESS